MSFVRSGFCGKSGQGSPFWCVFSADVSSTKRFPVPAITGDRKGMAECQGMDAHSGVCKSMGKSRASPSGDAAIRDDRND
jgi:hypothetical protein